MRAGVEQALSNLAHAPPPLRGPRKERITAEERRALLSPEPKPPCLRASVVKYTVGEAAVEGSSVGLSQQAGNLNNHPLRWRHRGTEGVTSTQTPESVSSSSSLLSAAKSRPLGVPLRSQSQSRFRFVRGDRMNETPGHDGAWPSTHPTISKTRRPKQEESGGKRVACPACGVVSERNVPATAYRVRQNFQSGKITSFPHPVDPKIQPLMHTDEH